MTCDFGISQSLNLYTHIPAFLISVVLGLFVLMVGKKNPVNRNLFIFILFFCFWVINDLFQWIVVDEKLNLFLARIAVIDVISLLFFLFFAYALVGKNLNFKKKILFAIPFIPLFVFMFSDFNVSMSGGEQCNTNFGPLYWYVYVLILGYTLWAISVMFFHYRKNRHDFKLKNQLKLIMSGIFLDVLWFVTIMSATYISVKNNYSWGDKFFMFTPFSMVIFLIIITYAITKYQFLNIKLIATQVLVYSLIILIGSQFFFIQNRTNQILNGVTLLLAIIFGIFLIKSVKAEIRRKEELQDMTEKLAIANDQLRKLDNAKSEFISIASHQLRTPLTAIKGYASLILEGTYGEVNQGITEPINKIYASNERLVQLVEELLNISKIESGKMEFNFEKHRIEDIVKDLSDTFVILAKDKKLYFNTELPEEPTPEVEIDTSKIREVISNLIDNSIKYTRRGGVNVKVELVKNATWKVKHQFKSEKPVIMDGAAVKITVSDTGIGIPKDDLSYLFSKFSRGRDTKRLHANGTGLGLYVGKNIIEAHHGKIWAESEGAEKGSRFIIELPLEQPK